MENLLCGAEELKRLRDIVMHAPNLREDKIQSLRRRIEDGSYQVSAEVLADKILGAVLSAEPWNWPRNG